MKALKKNMIQLLMLGLVLGSYLLFKAFAEFFAQYPELVPLVMTAFMGVLYFAFYRTFIYPLRELNKEIAMFITGNRKGDKLRIAGTHPSVQFVINFFNKVLDSLKNIKKDFLSGKTLKGEVEIAAEIQKLALSRTHVQVAGLQIVANAKSASEVGGDSYDIIERGDNTYVYVGDVTGHGVASGFVMMIVNALIAALSKLMARGNEILGLTNEIMKPRVRPNMMMTLLLLRWNEPEKKLYLTGAGHENLLVWKKATNEVKTLKSGGMALGMLRDIRATLKETPVDFQDGDIAVMYTDGITEAHNSAGESFTLYGLQRLVESVRNAPVKTAQGVFNNITVELSKFMGYQHKQFDDISLIVTHYVGEKPPAYDVSKEIPTEYITEWKWG